jgi:glycosyltransferase involved in cell wall biosynthesis
MGGLLSSSAANAAIVYARSNYDTSKGDIFGRVSASESILRALVRHGELDTLYCHALRPDDFAAFNNQIKAIAHRPLQSKFIPIAVGADLREPGCLFRSSPSIAWHAWQRRYGDPRAYSLCGITHTTLEQPVLDGLGELVTGPMQPWDALICTSQAVKTMVEAVIDGWGEYLAEKFAGAAARVVRLPVIPLGVESADFERTGARLANGRALRAECGVGEDDIAVLFLGRLSFTEKANPLPMLIALERAAKQTQKRIHLLMAGWFHKDQAPAMQASAAKLAPSVHTVWLDGRRPAIRTNVWFAADIFASLPDNYQETFGLTPIEAMAAGLPVVVADWNGYRDTVRDGIDGIRVPTLTPPPGAGWEIALRHHLRLDPYERYSGMSAQSVAVDADAAARAFVTLIEDAELRRTMGEAGAARARATYDWPHIVRAYQELWADLAEHRRTAAEISPTRAGAPVQPLRDDPFRMFPTYGTASFAENSPIRAAEIEDGRDLDFFAALPVAAYPAHQLPDLEKRRAMLEFLAAAPDARVGDVVARFDQIPPHRVMLALGWLAKVGLVEIGV